MNQRNNLMLAALTSALMPGTTVAGVRESDQANATDSAHGIDQAVVRDTTGRSYDVFAAACEEGRTRLDARVRAARTLAQEREPGGLGFAVDRVVAYTDGKEANDAVGTAVMVATHHDGQARALSALTMEDCASVGTAIGAIHRLRPNFLEEAGYPVFSTGQIRAQLTAWIKRLRKAGHIPAQITSSWDAVLQTDGLWSFSTCPTHGGWHDGDLLFSGSTVTAVTNWQHMQVNDPARDLAWTFACLDETRRNAVLSAYGRMLGSRLDDLIMLRAHLWLQMEEVGEFIQALNRADNAAIMQFKARVERLAHQLSTMERTSFPGAQATSQSPQGTGHPPSTITVGTLLRDADQRASAAQRQRERGADDETGESDRTGSSPIATLPWEDATADRPVGDVYRNGDAASAPAGGVPSQPTAPHHEGIDSAAVDSGTVNNATIALDGVQRDGAASITPQDSDIVHNGIGGRTGDDDTDSSSIVGTMGTAAHASRPDAPATVLIPLPEREERARRDAQADLETQIVRTVAPTDGNALDDTTHPADANASATGATENKQAHE